MKLAEKIALAIAVIALIAKFALIKSGSNEVFMISLTILAGLYFPLGFAVINAIRLRNLFMEETYQNIKTPRIVGAVGLGFALSVETIGILFDALNLTGATEMLVIGAIMLAVTLLVAFAILIFKKKSPDSFYKGVFIRGGIALILGVILISLPPYTLMRIFHRDCPRYVELFVKADTYPYNPAAEKEFDEYREACAKAK